MASEILRKLYCCFTSFLFEKRDIDRFFIEKEVVWYDKDENLGIRLGTIPFEDIFYGMLLILGIVYFYEKFESRRKSNADK